MQESQTNDLRAALERAAATLRQSQPMTANQYVAQNFGGMAPPGPSANQYVAANFPPVMAQGGSAPVPAPTAHAAPVPMPQARPASAPQAAPNDGGMSFFTRNAMMMQDPVTGQYIDPQGAARAQSSMPQQDQGSLIQKMLGRLTSNASMGTPGTNANGSIAGASGPTSVGGAPLASAPYPGANSGILSKAAWYLNGN